MINVR